MFSGPGKTLPLLKIKTCMNRGANGNCGVSTFLFAYDQKADRNFASSFSERDLAKRITTRKPVIENDPLLATSLSFIRQRMHLFVLHVEVYNRTFDSEYSRTLRYRSPYWLRRRQSSRRHRFRNARDPSTPRTLENRGCCQGRSKTRPLERRKSRPVPGWRSFGLRDLRGRLGAGLRPALRRRLGRMFHGRGRPVWLGAWLRSPPPLAVLEPVTFPVHLQDVDVMGEPVQQQLPPSAARIRRPRSIR